jgi:hypothetical protein
MTGRSAQKIHLAAGARGQQKWTPSNPQHSSGGAADARAGVIILRGLRKVTLDASRLVPSVGQNIPTSGQSSVRDSALIFTMPQISGYLERFQLVACRLRGWID